jgi:hypothetical protein
MSDLCQTGSRDQPNISRSHNGKAHDVSPGRLSEKQIPRRAKARSEKNKGLGTAQLEVRPLKNETKATFLLQLVFSRVDGFKELGP